MNRPNLDSASGLRPASAFVMIAFVLALAAVWVGRTSFLGEFSTGARTQFERDLVPEYTIVDRDQRPMALFVQRLDLVMSPNAMWQAHTPDIMAQAISEALGGSIDEAALIRAMIPGLQSGVLDTALVLDEVQADRVDLWTQRGSLEDGEEYRPIEGIFVDWNPSGGGYRLRWAPEVALSEAVRARHGSRYESNPMRWSRFLADGLASCILGEDVLGPRARHEDLEQQREQVWQVLMPRTHALVVKDFPADRAAEVSAMLEDQHVAWHQMHLVRDRNRRYPAGHMPLLGGWGFVEQEVATVRVLEAMGLDPRQLADGPAIDDAMASLSADEQRLAHRGIAQELAQPHPLTGLERACEELLSGPDWDDRLVFDPASYAFQRNRPVRQKARTYYLDSHQATEPPRVFTTFDMLLQRAVGEALDRMMEEHRCAVAQAIVVDVKTGDVLALDSRESYGVAGFAPLFHVFTPGSTFKVIAMATALDEGAVRPGDTFDVGKNREYRLGRSRVLREAEASKTGILTASECLAHSVNAGMVQVAAGVDPVRFHSRLMALGYGGRPQTGLGGERRGHVPQLPWKSHWEQASVSFGHELGVTLWQHATALMTVIRGGERVSLRLLDAVEQQDRRWVLPAPPPVRIFSKQTSLEVRAMMALGAQEGTGRTVARPELLPGIAVGTKTGTAQKVPSELCLHLEMEDMQRHAEQGTPCSRACRTALKAARKPHRNCYTSSMFIFGHVLGSEREVMVLVVGDEPRGKSKYGSAVAGPTAVAIFKEALGLTVQGTRPVADVIKGFGPADPDLPMIEAAEHPWAELGW